VPTLEAAAAGIAAALFGVRHAALMSVSAARSHGAIPRALSTAIVAAPAQHARIPLLDREAVVRFVKRETESLDLVPVTTDLGRALATGVEQTVLDLARRPSLGVADDQLPDAIRVLLAASDDDRLTELAVQQRKQGALRRARHRAE